MDLSSKKSGLEKELPSEKKNEDNKI